MKRIHTVSFIVKLYLWLIVSTSHEVVHGWVLPTTSAISKKPTTTFLSAETATTEVLGGVADFETWFSGQPKASCRSSVKHTAFGSLRGLSCSESVVAENTQVLTLPKELVLQAPYGESDWDAQLAETLWKECLKGSQSKVYGYCSLLTRGTPVTSSSVPPSTAPNALRHWTPSQRQVLESSPSGLKLLELQQQQESIWKSKFDSTSTNMSWQQFEWAMEVVHSRAFKGDFGLKPERTIVLAAVPLLAAAVGYFGVLQNEQPNNIVLAALAAIAAAPTVFNLLSPQQGDAVLLPLIDSANHLEESDSSIEYDPLKNAFTLSVGPKSLVNEDGGQRQLYISYGTKKDTELLLNYGFLPGVPSDDVDDNSARDGQRRRLAEAFLRRNS